MCLGVDMMSSSPVSTYKGTDYCLRVRINDRNNDSKEVNKCKDDDVVYLRWSNLTDAAFLCDRSDLADEAERIGEILPARLKHRTLGGRQELRVHVHDAGETLIFTSQQRDFHTRICTRDILSHNASVLHA